MESLLNQIYLKKENLDNYLHKAKKSSFSEPFFILILLFFVSFHIYTFIFRNTITYISHSADAFAL